MNTPGSVLPGFYGRGSKNNCESNKTSGLPHGVNHMNKPIQPLFIMPNLLGGGAERVLLTLLRNLGADFQPWLLLLRNEIAYPDEIPPHIHLVTISQKGERIRDNLPKLRLFLKELDGQCDLIVGGLELDATYWAYTLGLLTHKPVIGWVHTLLPVYLQDYPRWHKHLSRWIYPRLKRVICSSEDIEAAMNTFMGQRAWQKTIIPNPLDLEWITNKSEEAVPAWMEPVQRKPFIIALGRLNDQKGFDILLRGFALAVERGLDYHLLILGEGSQRQVLEELANTVGVASRLFLPGFVPNPYPFIQRAAMLVSPSRYEGVGMNLLEAMALMVPVIANTTAGGMACLVENGQYGIPVENNSPEPWAEALFQACHCNQEIIANGYQKAASFTPEQAVRQWQVVFECCMDK